MLPPKNPPASNLPELDETFAYLNSAIQEMKQHLDLMSELSGPFEEKAASFKEGLLCLELALMYYSEANRAIQAKAWFAATPVAAAALEAVLMCKCFYEQDAIKALPKWRTLKKSQRDNFGTFVRSLDLGKLLEIAQLLKWFPDGGIPSMFLAHLSVHLDVGSITTIIELFGGVTNVGQVCATHVREYRNLLHPAVCLKENRMPSPEAGLSATFMFLIAFTSLTVKT